MAKPTQEEIRKRKKALEAELLGGLALGTKYTDLMGVPQYSKDTFYIPNLSLPAGIPVGGGDKQTLIDELTDLQLALEAEQMKVFGQELDQETKKQRRAELYATNYEDYIKPALSTAYGGIEEKKKAAPRVLGMAEIPQAPSMSEAGEPTLLTPFLVQSKSVGTEIDWKSFGQALQDEGKSQSEANAIVLDTKKTLGAYMALYPDLDAQTAYSNLMAEMEAIENAPKIKKPETEGFEKTTSAFDRQVTEADMPADLTPEQMEVAKTMIVLNQNKVYNAAKQTPLDKPIPHISVTIDPTTGGAINVPASVYAAIMSGNPKLPNYEPFISEEVDNLIRNGIAGGEKQLTLETAKNPEQALETFAKAEAITKAGNPNAWYLNPETKRAVLEDPEKYVQRGFFSNTSPFGDVAETGGAYGFRMVMSPLNAIAGVAQPVLEAGVGAVMGGAAETAEFVTGFTPESWGVRIPEADYFDPFAMSRARAEQRAKDTPLYADSPILANIALNKGFTGEAQDVANAMNLKGWQETAVIGGGFLLDVGSPDIGIIAAAGKTATSLPKIAKAQKAMFGTSEGAIKQALKAGGNTFMKDLNIISAPLSKTKFGKTLKNTPHGSIASHVGETTAATMKASREIKTAQSADEVLAIVRELPERQPYRVAVEEAVQAGRPADAIDPLAVVRQADETNVKLIDEWNDTQRALEDLSQGSTRADAVEFRKANEKLLDTISADKFGKAFDDLADADKASILTDTAKVIDKQYAQALTINTLGAKGLSGLDEVFAVTGKTFAHEEAVPKLIARANGSELGKVLADIRTTAKVPSAIPVVGRRGGGEVRVLADRAVERVFKLDVNQATRLSEQVLNNPNIPEALKAAVARDLSAGNSLTFPTFRALVDTNIDNTARIVEGAFGSEDISRLAPETQERILRLQGETGIVGKTFKRITGVVFKDTFKEVDEAIIPQTSIELRQAQKDIMNEASTMDAKLRRTFDGLLSNNDDAVRELYDVTIPKGTPLTPDQALGYAIVGPRKGVSELDIAKDVSELSDWAASRLFFTSDMKVSFLDSLTGRRQIISNELLNERGRTLWKTATDAFGVGVAQRGIDSGDLLRVMREDLFEDYARIVQDPANLRVGKKPQDVISRMDKALAKYNEELAVGMYYYTEGTRIVNKKIKDLTDAEVLKLDAPSILGRDFRRAEAVIGDADGKFKEATAYYIHRALNNPDGASVNEVVSYMLQGDRTLQTKFANSGYNMNRFMANLSNNERARVSLYATIARKADDTANIINKNMKLNVNKLPTDLNKLDDIVDLLATDEQMGKLILGDTVYQELIKQAQEGNLASLTNELDRLIRGSTNASVVWRGLHNFVTGVNSFFYNTLLTYNPRFHGGNVVTAPSIMYQTTGSLAGLNPRLLSMGRRIAFQAQDPTGRWFYEIATIDRTGRPWTYGELNEVLLTSGIKSEYEFVTKGLGRDGLTDYIKLRNMKAFGLGPKADKWVQGTTEVISQTPANLVMKEDQVFRATVMIEALEQGKSIEAATTLARKSLFDYDDMSAAEKALSSRYFVFYAFQRQNFVNYIQSLGDVRKLKRYLNTYKAKRGTEIAVIEQNDNMRFDDRFFMSDMFTNRMLLEIQQREEDIVGFASPPIPALDAQITLFNMFYENPAITVGGQITGMLRPSLRRTLGIDSKFDREYFKVPPELIAGPVAMGIDAQDPIAVASFYQSLLGGQIIPRQGTTAEGAVNGWVYPLDLKQRAKLKTYIAIANETTGILSLNANYYKLFTEAQGTTYEGVGLLPSMTTTPMKMTEKDRIEYYNLMSRQRALEEELKEKQRQLRGVRGQ
jgi:hypothetical protein